MNLEGHSNQRLGPPDLDEFFAEVATTPVGTERFEDCQSAIPG